MTIKRVCISCYQVISNPICVECFKRQIDLWLKDYDIDRTFEINSPFIFTDSEAEGLGRRWIRRFTNSINKIDLDMPYSVFPIELDDFIRISHDEPPSGAGGWDERFVEIVDLNINNKKKIISISGYDAQEVGEHYFILGDINVQGSSHLTASETDRFYGYLCTGGGTMRDGNECYKLW